MKNETIELLNSLGDLSELFGFIGGAVFIVNDSEVFSECSRQSTNVRVLMFSDIDDLIGLNVIGGSLYRKRLSNLEIELIMARIRSRVGSLDFLKQL